MKKLMLSLILSGLVTNMALYANETGTTQSQAPAPAPAAAEQKAAPAPQKMHRHEARKECLKENPSLKGKELKECVKGKMGK